MTPRAEQVKILAQALGYWKDAEFREKVEFLDGRGKSDRLDFYLGWLARQINPDDPMLHPFLPDPEEGEVDAGDIDLGELSTSGAVRVPASAFKFNELVIAAPGLGKTVQVANQVTKITAAITRIVTMVFIPQWLIDFPTSCAHIAAHGPWWNLPGENSKANMQWQQ